MAISSNPVPLQFPLKGISENAAYAGKPGANAVREDHVLNVRAHDALERRRRGGRRTGISKFFDNQVNGSAAVQHLTQVTEAVALTESAGWSSGYDDPPAIDYTFVYSMDFHPDGDLLAVFTDVSPEIRIYEWLGDEDGFGAELFSADAGATIPNEKRTVAWHPSGDFLAVAPTSSDNVRLFSFNRSGGLGTPADVSASAPDGIAWHPSGDFLACASDSLEVIRAHVFNASTGVLSSSVFSEMDQFSNGGEFRGLDFGWHPDGDHIFYVSQNPTDMEVRPFNASTGFGAVFDSFTDPDRAVYGLDVASNGAFVGIGLRSGVTPNRTGVVPFSKSTGLGSGSFGSAASADVNNSVSVSPDGNYIVTNYEESPWLDVFPITGGSTVGGRLPAPLVPPSGYGGDILWTPDGGGVIAWDNADDDWGGSFRFTPETTNPSARKTRVVAVAGGNVYRSNHPPTSLALSTSGASAVSGSGPVYSIFAFQKLFFVDGTVGGYQYLDLADNTVKDWSDDLTAGSLPAGTDDTSLGCRFGALYRGRVVIAGLQEEPQNWFMPMSGDPFDFDYSPSTTSQIQAVAGNNSDVGELGDVVTALIPFQDDLLFMGGANSLWAMRGDPAAGGQIDNLSRQVGVIGPEAWTWDTGSTLYFFGINGLYRVAPNSSQPDLLSRGRMDRIFSSIDTGANAIRLVYDAEWQGVHIFISPLEQPDTASHHYFWDQRTDSFWRDQYPAAFGPSAMLLFQADDPEDRAVLLGGYDGYVRKFDDAANDDDGTAIESYANMPPLHPGLPMGQFQISDLQMHLDANGGGATLDIYRGKTPEEAAMASASAFTKTLEPGRNLPIRKRLRANALMMRLRSVETGAPWAYENGAVLVAGVGRQRARLST